MSIPEVGLLELGSEATAAALDAYRGGQPDGVAAWIVHWAQAVALGGRAGREVSAGVAAGT